MEKIKEHDNLFLWIVISIFSSLMIFQIGIHTGDELWNFQNIYKMVNGYTIYKDANVIITPIFFWIGEIIFKIFVANYFIYRLFDVCIYSTMILIVYNILKQIKVRKRNALVYTLIIHYFLYNIVTAGANYNTLAILFVLFGVYISLKYDHNQNQYTILNGITIYLAIFTKQNIGIYYLIGTIITQLLTKKQSFKTCIINIFKQMIVTAMLSILTLGALAYNGNLAYFINYAFLGIGEFGTRNVAIEIVCVVHLAIAIITIICAIFIQKKIANEEQKRNITVILVIGIIMLLTIYPIINTFHTMVAILVLMILLMYLTNIVIEKMLKKKIANIVIGFMIIIFILLGLKAGIIIIKNNPFTLDYKDPYYGGIIANEIKTKIDNVNKYIKENNEKVIIFSQEAALYNVPKKRSNGVMDLPFLGNMGYGGEDAMLEQVKNKKGYQILLTKENYWQESDKITNYIREHYDKIGEIEEFEIYNIN